MSAIETAFRDLESKIGSDIGVSDWITVDQAKIDAFAAVTHDDQWIHIDPDRAAAETPFGGAIAHGFLTLSLASRFAYDVLKPMPGTVMGINYGFDKLRFVSPVVAGSRVRGHFSLKSITQKSPTTLLRSVNLSIEIEGQDKPALIAEWLGMIVFDDTR